MNEKEVLAIFEKTGALLRGHFKLSSGLHSGEYLQCAKVLQYPKYAEMLCQQLADYFKKEKPTCVIAPALGGVIVSYATARALNVRALFTEREENRMVLRRGFEIKPEDRVLVVEDVITTGLSTKEVIDAVGAYGSKIVGVGSLINRSEQDIDFGINAHSLLKLQFPLYQPEECPLCKDGAAVIKPGSRA